MGEAAPERLNALFSPFNRSDEPGCTVAAARKGRLIFRRAFGMASLERGVANLPSTLMPVGSLSKQFTCAALLLLEAEGALSLRDLVGRWLPELPQAQHTPTLAQVMKHQGGIRCYLDQWMFAGYRTMPAGMPWAIQSRQQGLNFEPGGHSAYSNGGYLLLSAVIERASGLTFAEFMQRRLFQPCGMTASAFPDRRAAASPDAATAYVREEPGGWTPAPYMTEEASGDGGLISSSDDLLRWARHLRASGSEVNIEALAAPAEPWAPGPSDYRYGLLFQSWRGLRLAQHTGGLPGANSALVMLRDHEVDVVVLFNRPGPAMSLALKVVETLVGGALEDSTPPCAADYDDLLGSSYLTKDGSLFGFIDKDKRLTLSLFGDPPVALEGWSAGEGELPFWADVGAAQMRFRRGPTPTSLDVFDGASWTRADSLALQPPSPDWLGADRGVPFHSADACATLRLELRDGRPFLHVQGETWNGAYQAETIAPNLLRFWPPQFPAGKLARLIRRDGVLQSVIVSTPRTRGLVFNRTST